MLEIDAEIVLGIKRPGDGNQGLGEVRIDAPVAVLVGLGQGGAGDVAANAHVVELALLRPQAGLDIAQAVAVGELRERHAQELVETREALDFVMPAVTLHAAVKSLHRQVVGDLREDDLTFVHQPVL